MRGVGEVFLLLALQASQPHGRFKFITEASATNGTLITELAGSIVRLPCDVTPPNTREVVSLVLWFKEDIGKPIYSVEAREGGDISAGSSWSDENHFGRRAKFVTDGWRGQAALQISGIRGKEAGLYRCRVDFKEAATRNSMVNLTVIVPPDPVLIYDEEGKERKTFVGPYHEGESMSLHCDAFGGWPSPRVTWTKNGKLIDETFVVVGNGTVRNEVTVHRLGREDLHTEYTCTANNNNISRPVTNTLHVDMNFAPSTISIETRDSELVAGTTYEVICTSSGSRPPAQITWYLDDIRIEGSHDSTSGDGNTTLSILNLNPKVDHIGAKLSCRARNPLIDNSQIQDDWTLAVSYAPSVELVLGKSISADTIYEGGDVYFDCKVRSSPPPEKIIWLQNDEVISHNKSMGVIVTNHSLVLQKIGRERTGDYICEAKNRVGKGRSQAIPLDVKYVPVCKSTKPVIYGVGKKEVVNVLCSVTANPTDVEFKWTFNNSAEIIRVPRGRTIANLSSSTLTYTPVTTMDYGTLMCTASNQVGMQKDPCIFHIILAVVPDTVENCSVINKSSETFHLRCVEGFDGGMKQTFHITVKELPSGHVKYENSSLDKPDVLIDNLSAGHSYMAEIVSRNKKGGSVPKHHLVETLQQPEIQLVEEKLDQPDNVSWDLVTGVTLGVVICLSLLIGVSVAIKVCVCRRRRHAAATHIEAVTGSTSIVGVASPLKTSKRKGILKRHQSWDCDASPDLIPQSEDCDFCQSSDMSILNRGSEENSTDSVRLCNLDNSSLTRRTSKDGLLLVSSGCDGTETLLAFPDEISASSTLKRGAHIRATDGQKSSLIKQKRESIV